MKDLLVLDCMLVWVKPVDSEDEMTLSVGGLYEPPTGGNAHPRWVERMNLQVGDEVTIRLVNSDVADEPTSETVSTPEWIREQEKKYFEHVKAKFEDE